MRYVAADRFLIALEDPPCTRARPVGLPVARLCMEVLFDRRFAPCLDKRKRQRYNCLMIPPLEPGTGNLPPGIHEAAWSEVLVRYGSTPRRLSLLAGLQLALGHLRQAGCARAYLDGSFVTAKVAPNDFDACWEMAGVDFDLLDTHAPVLLDWSKRRAAQKALFGGELFIAESSADPWGTPYLEFFQRDRTSGDPKGIVAINRGGLP